MNQLYKTCLPYDIKAFDVCSQLMMSWFVLVASYAQLWFFSLCQCVKLGGNLNISTCGNTQEEPLPSSGHRYPSHYEIWGNPNSQQVNSNPGTERPNDQSRIVNRVNYQCPCMCPKTLDSCNKLKNAKLCIILYWDTQFEESYQASIIYISM